MKGSTMVGILLGVPLVLGGFMYYFQTRAYYGEVTLATPVQEQAAPKQTADAETTALTARIRLTAQNGKTTIRLTRVWDNQPEIIAASDFEGIDAPTSPLKFKGCFKVGNSIPMMTEAYVTYADPTPLKAPGWFGCYDYETLTTDLESGEAVAFLSEGNLFYGVDRVVAVYGDGRAYTWQQINACGTAVYDGSALPKNCPPKPKEN
ncbi:MAG: histidine kinase [Alphaproteobacteria bacterium]|nr:histidine kinase [Alphaproteobacteria bacterium]